MEIKESSIRSCMDEILPGLFLGGASATLVNNDTLLKKFQIQVILDIGNVAMSYKSSQSRLPNIKWHRFPLENHKGADIIPVLQQCIFLIQEANQQKKAVLVHCQGGIHRSPSIVAGYLYYISRDVDDLIDMDAIVSLVKTKRPVADPPRYFLDQIVAFC